ncbi:DUF421 domain-containing protein [Brevibacillus humidisoli]|uniref:DUF421 domain-containing protein n=1 Tax=Brevibacillus humidisoli TaxID=2895522 RepID=UPI001E31777A|nr:DUF421 domain-containing protein [Brevibacillus humidisoli]UFJ39012.1 DUF421 domain-containing protein [Brevibacillus humidisoli]
MDLTTILLRTLLTYFFILLLLRLMGKRELGKMSVFDVVISIMLAEMAVLAIEEAKQPVIHFYLPMIAIGLLEIGMATLSLKSRRVRDWIEGSPSVLIENGEIREHALRQNRINLDDLLIQLRQKNISHLADVEFAILEPTGELSVFPKREKQPVTREDLQLSSEEPVSPVTYNGLPIPLILDGKVREDALKLIGQNTFWLKQEIRKRGIREFKEISFCSLDSQGRLFIDKKDKTYPRRR